jgi:SAM-dependent methyltransferase
MKTRDACPLCECKNNTSIHTINIDDDFFSFIEKYYGKGGGVGRIVNFIDKDITYSKCLKCKLVFQKNILNDDGMFELYENLIDSSKSLEKRTSVKLSHNLRSIFLIFNLLRKIPKNVADIVTVDLGMGFGNMLSHAKALGCVKSYGIELSKVRIDYAKNQFGVDSFSDLECLEDESIDLMLSNQSLEHIPNLRGTLNMMERKLAVGGFVYIAVPNGKKSQKFLSKGIYHPLEHINTFMPNSKFFLFSNKMKYQFMLKNLKIANRTIWLFKKIK